MLEPPFQPSRHANADGRAENRSPMLSSVSRLQRRRKSVKVFLTRPRTPGASPFSGDFVFPPLLHRNDSVGFGRAVVSTAVFGVSPKTSPHWERAPNGDSPDGKRLAGETPARATGRSEQHKSWTAFRSLVALPRPIASFRQGEKIRMRASRKKIHPKRECRSTPLRERLSNGVPLRCDRR